MSQLDQVDNRRKSLFAVVVLFAVCALTVSLATRYCGPSALTSSAAHKVLQPTSPEAKRQHLAKNALNAVPRVVCVGVVQAPSFYPRISPAGPPLPNIFFEESLYNRPPPVSSLS